MRMGPITYWEGGYRTVDATSTSPRGPAMLRKGVKLTLGGLRKLRGAAVREPGQMAKGVLGGVGKFMGVLLVRGTMFTFVPPVWGYVHALLLAHRLGPVLLEWNGHLPDAQSVALAPRCARLLSESIVLFDCTVPALFATVPNTARSIMYLGRAAPLFVAYFVKKFTIPWSYKLEDRHAVWAEFHAWGAERMADLIEDFGGFYRKVGQIMGTAAQMMPPQYIECFSRTMDNNPPVPIVNVVTQVERAMGCPLPLTFTHFNAIPTATASVAQVHFATLKKDGREVAVKVQICKMEKMLQDIKNMEKTAYILKATCMDGGIDLPTIMRAYTQVIEDEFNFEIEARSLGRFAHMFREAKMDHLVELPKPVHHLSTTKLLVMEKVEGVKLIDVLLTERAPGTLPECPPEVAALHRQPPWVTGAGANPWAGVFHTLHKAWGYMTLVEGTFHTDPHPGNLLLLPNGKIGLLDWGQLKTLPTVDRLWLCRLVLAMSAEDYEVVAELVKNCNKYCPGAHFVLENPTLEALNAVAYTYFDTRPTPLARVNVFDMNNSPMMKNRILQNTEQGFMVVRVGYLMRGLMTACAVDSSMVLAWEPYARLALQRAGESVPSASSIALRRNLTKMKVAYARRTGHAALDEVRKAEAMVSELDSSEQLAPWHYQT